MMSHGLTSKNKYYDHLMTGYKQPKWVMRLVLFSIYIKSRSLMQSRTLREKRRRERETEKKHTNKLNWTILENEIIYVLICFFLQILGQHRLSRGACSDDVEEKIGQTTTHTQTKRNEKPPELKCVRVCICVTRSIYMAPNHKKTRKSD